MKTAFFFFFLLTVLAAMKADAGLPPTTSIGAGDSAPVTTFKTDYGTIPLTHNGTSATIGTIPISAGGTGSTTQNFVDLTNAQTVGGAKNFTSDVTSSDFKFNDPAFSTISTKQALSHQMGTGVISGATLSIGSPTSTFSISQQELLFSDYSVSTLNPTVKIITCPALANQTIPNVTTQSNTYVSVDSTCAFVFSNTFPTQIQRRTNAFVGRLVHPVPAGIVLTAATLPDFVIDTNSQLYDLFDAIGAFNVSGNIISPNGANLSINKSAGVTFRRSVGYATNKQNPNTVAIAAQTPSNLVRFTQLAQVTSPPPPYTVIDPANFDVGGTVTAVSAAPAPTGLSASTNQRVYLFGNGQVGVQYGQVKYTNLANAIAGISTESFVVNPTAADGGILRAIISCRRDATDISDPSQCVITIVGRFDNSGVGTGSLATTTLQQAYDNSTTPQITTSTVGGSVDIKRGSAADTDNVLRIQNGSGTATATVTGAGVITGSNLSGTNTGDLTGKAQAGSQVTVNEIQTPNKLLTQTATGKYLNETGNNNILENPSFEHSTFSTSWTNSAGTFTQETTTVIDGAASAKLVLSSQTMSLTQSSTLYQAQFADGVQGLASIRIKSSVALSVCSIQAGTVSTSNCVTTNSDSKWGLYKIPFILGATSNGISIASSGAVSGTVYIDDAFVGAVDLKQDINVVGQWQSYTPTFTNLGTVTISHARWRQVGSNVEISIRATAGTVSAATQSFTLPNNYTADSSLSTSTKVGTAGRGASSTTQFAFSTLAAPSSGTISIGTQSSTVNETAPATSGAFGNSEVFNILASVPTNELKGASSVYTAQCGANCVDTFGASVSSAGVVSGENVEWITGDASLSDTSLYSFTFKTGLFTVSPNCTVSPVDTGTTSAVTVKSASISNTTLTVRTGFSTTSSSFTKNQTFFTVSCQKQGADFVATRTIQGSFNEVMTTPGISKPKTCYYAFGGAGSLTSTTNCTSGTCAEYLDSCGSGSATFTSTGLYSATFAAGTFGSNSHVKCEASSANGANAMYTAAGPAFAAGASGDFTYTVFNYIAGGTTLSNARMLLKCEGQAP